MSAFAVNACVTPRGMPDTRDSQYSWMISVTQTSLIACLRFSALGMLDTRDSQYSWMISVTQTSLIAYLRFSALGGCLYTTLSFKIVHRFSIGLRPGLFLGISAQRSFCSSGTQWLPLIGDKKQHLA